MLYHLLCLPLSLYTHTHTHISWIIWNKLYTSLFFTSKYLSMNFWRIGLYSIVDSIIHTGIIPYLIYCPHFKCFSYSSNVFYRFFSFQYRFNFMVWNSFQLSCLFGCLKFGTVPSLFFFFFEHWFLRSIFHKITHTENCTFSPRTLNLSDPSWTTCFRLAAV